MDVSEFSCSELFPVSNSVKSQSTLSVKICVSKWKLIPTLDRMSVSTSVSLNTSERKYHLNSFKRHLAFTSLLTVVVYIHNDKKKTVST